MKARVNSKKRIRTTGKDNWTANGQLKSELVKNDRLFNWCRSLDESNKKHKKHLDNHKKIQLQGLSHWTFDQTNSLLNCSMERWFNGFNVLCYWANNYIKCLLFTISIQKFIEL